MLGTKDTPKDTPKEKKCVFLMGPPRVTKSQAPGSPPLRLSGRADAMELLALLILAREFGVGGGVKEEGEVRRDWLLRTVFPDTAISRKERDRLVYLLNGDLGLDKTLGVRTRETSRKEMRRELNVIRLTFDHVWIDALEIVQAARHPHVPARQDEIIRLGDRPLLEGMGYPWLQQPAFQALRWTLDGHYLAALAGKADGLIVRMEAASGRGQADDAERARIAAIPLLDKAAERLAGYESRHALAATFADLQSRAKHAPASRRAATPNNLPRPITSFIGRGAEKARIKALLAAERLVTLTGMGGSGKTRLALETALELLAAGWEGVWLVELASLTDPDLIPATIAVTLGPAERENKDVLAALISRLQGRKTLLLLDNCEHLIGACAEVVHALLRACPGLTILTTSRQRLDVEGEFLLQVPPLPFPSLAALPPDALDSADTILGYDAVRLFVDRVRPHREFELTAQTVRPVAAICESLDGIPLALELAAARLRTLPVDDVADMLADRFGFLVEGRRLALPRHKTLRAVVDWSYDLLSGPEQRLLCRLSVFAGGWTRDAAEAVGAASEDTSGTAVGDLLTSLVDKSLVIAELSASPGRYRMLETVRQYAGDRLGEGGMGDESRRRHRAFCLALAEQAEPNLKGPDPKPWLDRLGTEIGNLRAALEWRADEEALRLACALERFWLVRDYLREGRDWLERPTQAQTVVSPSVQARALNAAGGLAFCQGEFEEALRLHGKSRELWTQLADGGGVAKALNGLGAATAHLGDYAAAKALYQESQRTTRLGPDPQNAAEALNGLAMIANYQCEYDGARTLLAESLTLMRQAQDVRGIASSLYDLAIIAYYGDRLDEAASLFEESLTMWRPLGDKYSIAKSLNGLGEVALYQGEARSARELYQESLDLRRQTGDKYGEANSLNGLGEAAFLAEDYPVARTHYEESLKLRRQIADQQSIPHSLHNLGQVAFHLGEYDASRALFADSLRQMRANGDQYGIAHSLEGLALVTAACGEGKTACRLLGAAEALRKAINNPRPPRAQEKHQSQVTALLSSLGPAEFDAAWAAGQAMTWEQAVAFALGETAA